MKSVISLVKVLGVKSTAEVLELLRQVGVDTEAEGFGVMSKVDDETVSKLHNLKSGNGVAKKATPTVSRRKVVEQEDLDLGKSGLSSTRAAGKDFFGTRKKAEKPDEQEKKTVKREVAASTSKPSAAKPGKPAAKPSSKSAVKPAAKADRGAAKPDLSQGPRIIAMPDPQDVEMRRRDRTREQTSDDSDRRAPSPGSDPRKTGRGKRKTKTEDYGGGRRRKLKDIGVVEDEGRIRSRKRVFKVAGQPQDGGQAVVPHIKITGEMQLRDVAKSTGVKISEIVRFLMQELDIMANINYLASVDEIQLIADHFEIKHSVVLDQVPEGELEQFEESNSEKKTKRPPVVTVMGHVDHGKTKLLDTIRLSNVIEGEAGGITQHIGAYQVEYNDRKITFLDTPGHEAFTAMRARGSQVTDIVILVVAADDGVMPQTVEAIEHAKSAKVPILVAVNKIDKADANPDRVKNQLAERGLVPEDWGGDTVYVNISALKGDNIDSLLEMLLITADLLEPEADATAPPFGVVVESQVDTGIGVVATILCQQGTMAKGQFILSGTAVGRIKRMEDHNGKELANATPSTPVRIIGFTTPPENGDKVYCFLNKKQAQAIADQRVAEQRKKVTGASSRISLEAFYAKAEAGETKDLNLIVKADVAGSAEALSDSLKKISVEGAVCNVISTGVGQINDTDVNLATAANAVIIGFQVGISLTAKHLVEREHVDYRLYDIIYKVTEDIELAMKGLLEPIFEEQELGRAEIRAIFKASREGTVCGGYVLDGNIKRGAKYRLRRGTDILFADSVLNSLKRFKDDVREVASGYECGFMVTPPSDVTVEEGDIIEVYQSIEKKRD